MTGPAPTPPTATQGLPWRTFHSPGENYCEVHDDEGQEVATFYYGVLGAPWDDPDPAERVKAQQRAEYLVRAVNSFGPLVEALEGFLRRNGHTPACGFFPGTGLECIAECARARAALSAARATYGEGVE